MKSSQIKSIIVLSILSELCSFLYLCCFSYNIAGFFGLGLCFFFYSLFLNRRGAKLELELDNVNLDSESEV